VPEEGRGVVLHDPCGDKEIKAGAWYYPEPLAEAEPIKDLIAFYWQWMDNWYEEDEEIFVHPRDPYHRVDVLNTSRHIRISLDGELLAETERAQALFESNLPTRWYRSRARTSWPRSSPPRP
jgi:Uncharacterized protein conserved in bacteria